MSRALPLLPPLSLALVCALLLPAPARGQSGSVTGQVRLTGAEHGDARGAVVWLTGFSQPPTREVARIVQKGKRFDVDVLAIVAGQTVEFPNQDEVLHNVFSTSRARPFDLGKFRRGESKKVQFPKTGVVEVYCDIHEQMAATVLVLPNRAFAVVGPDGRFRLDEVPSGTWTLRAWHRDATAAARELTVEAGRSAAADLELSWAPRPTEHLDKKGRPYRARGGYEGPKP